MASFWVVVQVGHFPCHLHCEFAFDLAFVLICFPSFAHKSQVVEVHLGIDQASCADYYSSAVFLSNCFRLHLDQVKSEAGDLVD